MVNVGMCSCCFRGVGMSSVPGFADLVSAATTVATTLRERGERVAVSESAAGGLINAALVAVPGASDFYIGGMVVYTGAGRYVLAGDEPPPDAMRGATEEFARYQAAQVARRYRATWGIGETGATGPAGNPYGDPAGHGWVAVAHIAGPTLDVETAGAPDRSPSGINVGVRRLATGSDDRAANMMRFALAALELAAAAVASPAELSPSGDK